jgi:hypothetical protein
MKLHHLFAAILLSTFCVAHPAPTVVYAAPFLGSIADVESTHAGLARGCVEANPLFGARPSRLRMYSLTLPIALVSDIAARKIGKRGKWIPLSVAAGHGFAAAMNLRCK